MTITEVATLELISPNTWGSDSVAAFFHAVEERQKAWSGYPLLFFQDPHAQANICLVSGWDSVRAHEEWIASAGNQELLAMGKGLIAVKGLVHVDLDFDSMPHNAEYLRWTCGEGDDERTRWSNRGEDYVWEGRGKVLDDAERAEAKVQVYTEEPIGDLSGQKLLRRVVPPV